MGTHTDGQLLGEGIRIGKKLDLLRMGPGCGCGMGAGGMLQRLEVDPEDAGEPEAGVSRPCSLSVPHLELCTAVCGRPGTGEQLYCQGP